MSGGQLAMNTNLVSPGLFLKDSNGDLVKVGPVHVGTTAPNATPGAGGQAGNSKGEQWLDTSSSRYVFKIWDGTAWRTEDGEFVNASGDTMTGALVMDNQQQVRFRETTANGTNYIALQAPASVASDKTITLPDVTGTVVTTGDTGSVTSTMILDGTITNADINASAAIAGTKISPNFGSQDITISDKIIHAGDTNTAIRFPAADTIAFETGGSERARIDSSGKIGIGTTSPLAVTHIVSSSLGLSSVSPAGDELVIESSTAAGITIAGSTQSNIYFGDADDQDIGGIQYFHSDDSLTFRVNNAERARIDSRGNVFFHNSTPTSTIWGSDNAVFSTGYVGSNGAFGMDIVGNGYRNTAGGWTSLNQDGNIGRSIISLRPDATGGFIIFGADNLTTGTSPTERMRIDSSGNLLIGQSTTADPGSGNNTTGACINASGTGFFSRAAVGLRVNRTADGAVAGFASAGVEEGNISIAGNTVSYNQFLGSHWAALNDWSRPSIKIGTVMETINELVDWKYVVIEVEGEQKKICYNGTAEIGSTVTVEYEGEEYDGIVELEANPDFNKAVKVKVNNTAASKAVYGVFVAWNVDGNADGGIWNDMYVGAVGNYVIRMAAGQEPEIGDLVEADGTGCAVVQDDDIIRTKTVAKITTVIPQVTYDDGSFLVTCVLYCG
jgi:hypothetical protein